MFENNIPKIFVGTFVYCSDRGFGFIKPDQGGFNIFYHVSSQKLLVIVRHALIEDYKWTQVPKNERRDPHVGDRVAFQALATKDKIQVVAWTYYEDYANTFEPKIRKKLEAVRRRK